jgi:uncharacterized protein (TIGR02147 family)
MSKPRSIEFKKAKSEPIQKPSVYDYRDYHQYVSEMVQFLKKTDPSFSFRKFSKKVGFASSSVLISVASGARGLSADGVSKLAKGFSLTVAETKFFQKLLGLKKASLHTDKKAILEELVSDKVFCERHPLAPVQYRYYTRWYYSLIRELVLMGCNTRESIYTYVKNKIAYDEMEVALQDLQKLSLIRETKECFQVSHQIIATESEVTNDVFTLFQHEMISLAQNAIQSVARELRDIRSATFSIHQDDLPELKGYLEKVIVEAIRNFESKRSQRNLVMQLNVQAFPL